MTMPQSATPGAVSATVPQSDEGYDTPVRWRPFVDRVLAQERVSLEARQRDKRLPGYLDFMSPIPAEADEAYDIVQMLELLECTHGAAPVLAPLPVLQLALVSAVSGLGRGLTELASQRLYGSPALFVGALVEDDIEQAFKKTGKPLSQRRAPRSPVLPKAGSPNPDFEDFHTAARMMRRFEPIALQTMSRRACGVAAACWALRQQMGLLTEVELTRLTQTAGERWDTLASALLQNLRDRAIPIPPPLRACFVPKKK